MSNVEDKIKKVVEQNSNLNLKSTKDRAKLIGELSGLISSVPQVEVIGETLEQLDMFELKQKNSKKKAEKKKKQQEEGISNNPELNPMQGFVTGQVAKMVTHNRDIEEYYASLDKKRAKAEKTKRTKPKKTKKPTLEQIKKMDIKVPPKPIRKSKRGSLSNLAKNSPRN